MAGIQDNYEDEIRGELTNLRTLAAQLQLYLWVFRLELSEYFRDHPGPLRDTLANSLEEINLQFNTLLDCQRHHWNKQEQRALRNSIEITGIPEFYTKNMRGLVSILNILLRIRIVKENIRGYERIGDVDPQGSPRTLVVHFVDYNIKNRIRHVANFGSVYMPGTQNEVFFMEHLTVTNHKLLRKTRHRANLLQIRNVWFNEGRIFVQRDDNAVIHEISSDHDIENMQNF